MLAVFNRRTFAATLFVVVLAAAASVIGRQSPPAATQASAGPVAASSPLTLVSSDERLVEAFTWAKRQALGYAFDQGDAVGPWFEAALPGRQAFCMRDVSHQVMGAHALGLQRHTLNMLRRFANAVSEGRDWCGLWEIDRHNRPAHADYRDDADFWYNLPANFDVLDAIWRMYLWSGDPSYLNESPFRWFGERTVNDYVARWQLGLDTIMKRPRLMNVRSQSDPEAQFRGSRGIPGYNEEEDDFTVGLDLLATQYAGYHAWGRLLEARGDRPAARTWLSKAAELKAFVNRTWWDEAHNTFFDRLGGDGKLKPRNPAFRSVSELYWPVADEGPRAKAGIDRLLGQIRANPTGPVEEQSYHPEVLYRYGQPDVAYAQIMELTRADRPRREYPEVSYAVIGAIVTGVFGVSVDPVTPGHEGELLEYFANDAVTTVPQLTSATPSAELAHLPVRGNDITVRHEGQTATSLTNNHGPALVWRAAFPGTYATLKVNGVPTKATGSSLPLGRRISWVRIVVAPGDRVRVECVR